MIKDIMILCSEIVSYEFEDRNMEFNKITFAFRDKQDSDLKKGFDTVLTYNAPVKSFEVTSKILPNQLVKAELGTKRVKDGAFKWILTKVNGIEI